MKKYDQDIHMHKTFIVFIRVWESEKYEIDSSTKHFITILNLRFSDMSREREKISFYAVFSISLHHVRPPPQNTGLASASSENRLARSEFKSQITVVFFSNSKIFSASGHDVIHFPGPISYLGFLLWHLWLLHPPRSCVNTWSQWVHLTNPCTKPKVSQPN